ncbi:MAG TPA: class I SAM-dependent methyltransferase [Chloroflexia bacterium]|jgi:SAM-dependent methyltransferase|nr:class I SAM-dependent methyltransferase [Chloroflexia bacterium]
MSTEVWASALAYEPYMGRWSRLVAAEFLAWLDAPPGGRWIDLGCGTGALSGTILDRADPFDLTAIDRSAGYTQYARRQVRDDRARFLVGDATTLPLARGLYDVAVSGLVLNFVPRPEQMVAEMARVVRPHGLVAAYVWDYAGGMEFQRHFWDAAAALDPRAREVDAGQRFPLCRPEPLADLWRAVGLEAVETRAIDVPTRFCDFDDYWTPFLGGQGTVPGYVMSLSEERRAVLREHLRTRLPVAAGGAIALTARAWAVRGRRAGARG